MPLATTSALCLKHDPSIEGDCRSWPARQRSTDNT